MYVGGGGGQPAEGQSHEDPVQEHRAEEAPAPEVQSLDNLANESPAFEDPTSSVTVPLDLSPPVEAEAVEGHQVESLGLDSTTSNLVLDAAVVDDDVESGKGASLPMSPSSEEASTFGIPVEDKRLLRLATKSSLYLRQSCSHSSGNCLCLADTSSTIINQRGTPAL